MTGASKMASSAATLMAGVTFGMFGFSMAEAAAPMVKTSPPGFYRMMLGADEVTALSDGTDDLPVDKLMTNTTPAAVDEALKRSFEHEPLETSVNAFLVNTGGKLVLIDTGAGTLFGPTLGNLLASLRAAGYQPEAVDEILITHMHPDHIGGLLAAGKMAFPNAVVHANKLDADYWLSRANLDKADPASKGFFQGAQASLAPYVQAHHFETFEGDVDLAPGIRSVALPGHTPGHTGYMIESNGQRLLVWGDVVVVGAIQFANPSVTIEFDADAGEAAAERRKAFDDAASQGYWVAGAHLPFPGLGHVRAAGEAFEWAPANYSIVR